MTKKHLYLLTALSLASVAGVSLTPTLDALSNRAVLVSSGIERLSEKTEDTNSVTYTIDSQADFEALLNGTLYPGEWSNGDYIGTLPATVEVTCDITLTSDLVIGSVNSDLTLAFENITGGDILVKKTGNNQGVTFQGGTYDNVGIRIQPVDSSVTGTLPIHVLSVSFVNMTKEAIRLENESASLGVVSVQVTGADTDAYAVYMSMTTGGLDIEGLTTSGMSGGIYGRAWGGNSNQSFRSVEFHDVKHGITLANDSTPTITGRILGDNSTGSWGIQCAEGSYKGMSEIQNPNAQGDIRCEISGVETGIFTGQSPVFIDNSSISDVTYGIRPGSGPVPSYDGSFNESTGAITIRRPDGQTATVMVKNSTISGSEVGIMGNSASMSLVNTTIKDFRYGVYHDNIVNAINSTFKATEYNMIARHYYGYANTFADADYGLITDTALYDTNSVFSGDKAGIVHTDGSNFVLEGNVSLANAQGNNGFNSVATETTRPITVTGYEKGVWIVGSGGGLSASELYVHDCTTGICGAGRNASGGSGQLTPKGKIEVYDCVNGADLEYLNQTFANAPLIAHDCSGFGVRVLGQVSTNAQSGVEAYNCGTGMIVQSTQISQPTLNIHDNSGDGLVWLNSVSSGIIHINGTIKDNGGYNLHIICDNPTAVSSSFMALGSGLDIRGGGLGNLKAENVSGALRVTSPLFTNAKELYLSDGFYFSYLNPNSVTDNDNVFLYKVDDPSEGRQVGEVMGPLDSFNLSPVFISTHQFSANEGWVIEEKPITTTSWGLFYTEGCIVTYDYATNGGTSLESAYEYDDGTGNILTQDYTMPYGSNRRTYRKGRDVDLTPVGVRSGYRFVGWNTDPNAHTGLTSIQANTSNITLYAIYANDETITYHTYDSSKDYTDIATHYNNDTYVDVTLKNAPLDTNYKWVAYTSNPQDVRNTKSSNEVMRLDVTSKEVWLVYEKTFLLKYFNENGSFFGDTMYVQNFAGPDAVTGSHTFLLKKYNTPDGMKFIAWHNNDTNKDYKEQSSLTTTNTITNLYAKTEVLSTNQNRMVTIKGRLTYTDGTPIANKTIRLSYAESAKRVTENGLVSGAYAIQTETDNDGNYTFEDIYTGDYDLDILDGDVTLASCKITVTDKKDSVDVSDKAKGVNVDYALGDNLIVINATLKNPNTNTPSLFTAPKTGDVSPIMLVFGLMSLAVAGATVSLYKKDKETDHEQ